MAENYGRGFTADEQDYWDYYQPNAYGKNTEVTDFSHYKETMKKNAFDKGMNMLRDRSVYTPDINTLKTEGELFPVFIYGEEQNGKIYSSLTNGCEYYGRAMTCTNSFVLQQSSQEVVSAIAFETGRNLIDHLGIYGGSGKRLSGELYGVPLSVLCKFDKRYKNGWKFERKQYLVELSDPFIDKKYYQKSYIYLGVPEKFSSIKMSSGSVRYLSNGVDGVYYFGQ